MTSPSRLSRESTTRSSLPPQYGHRIPGRISQVLAARSGWHTPVTRELRNRGLERRWTRDLPGDPAMDRGALTNRDHSVDDVFGTTAAFAAVQCLHLSTLPGKSDNPRRGNRP